MGSRVEVTTAFSTIPIRDSSTGGIYPGIDLEEGTTGTVVVKDAVGDFHIHFERLLAWGWVGGPSRNGPSMVENLRKVDQEGIIVFLVFTFFPLITYI